MASERRRSGPAIKWLKRILIGVGACVLVIAGLIEGFISPSGLPWWVKLSVGLLTGIGLYSYWLLAGRESTPARPPVQLRSNFSPVPISSQ